jgi:uncharacterized protein (DUF1499 family)
MGIIAFLLASCSGERPDNLGVKDRALAPCPSSPNCVSSFAQDDRLRIAPPGFTGDADAAFARLKRVLAARDDSSFVEEGEGYLRIELRTRLFVDDAEFLLDRERRVIQVRSASRPGYSDPGKNRRRLEEIRNRFDASAE